MFLQPQNVADDDAAEPYYSEFLLWDTFRGAHPIYTLAAKEYVPKFVNSLVAHHIAYLYQYAGRGDRTAEKVREICRKFYRNAPDGLCGNEDHGEMSAWYVFACMGFYPVSPASGEYVLGAPQAPSVSVDVGGGKTFRVVAKGLSERAKYVKSVSLNGRPLEGFVLRHADIENGGELVFEMSTRPAVAESPLFPLADLRVTGGKFLKTPFYDVHCQRVAVYLPHVK